MNTQATADSPLNIVALGWGLSAALVVLFVMCLAIAFVFPDWRFSVAPMISVGLVYNYLIRR